MTEMSGIPCSRCEHTSDSGLAAFEHWRDNHKRREGEELGPGLHKVGPNPWDYVYNPAEAQQITVVGVDGRTMTGTVTAFTEDKETGSLELTVKQFPDALGFSGLVGGAGNPE